MRPVNLTHASVQSAGSAIISHTSSCGPGQVQSQQLSNYSEDKINNYNQQTLYQRSPSG
jgi:hypothetical protein